MPKFRIFYERPEIIDFEVTAKNMKEAIKKANQIPIEKATGRAHGDWEIRYDICEKITNKPEEP